VKQREKKLNVGNTPDRILNSSQESEGRKRPVTFRVKIPEHLYALRLKMA
jgi:hypothetical protein